MNCAALPELALPPSLKYKASRAFLDCTAFNRLGPPAPQPRQESRCCCTLSAVRLSQDRNGCVRELPAAANGGFVPNESH